MDLASGKELRTLETTEALAPGQDYSRRAVVFSEDGRLLAWGGERGTVVVWEVATGNAKTFKSGQAVPIRALAFSGDSRLLAAGYA